MNETLKPTSTFPLPCSWGTEWESSEAAPIVSQGFGPHITLVWVGSEEARCFSEETSRQSCQREKTQDVTKTAEIHLEGLVLALSLASASYFFLDMMDEPAWESIKIGLLWMGLAHDIQQDRYKEGEDCQECVTKSKGTCENLLMGPVQ